MLLGVVQHGIEAQALEVGYLNGLHLCGLNMSALASCDISQVPDGDGRVGGQVDTTFKRQEPIYFVLGTELGIELCGGDDLFLICYWVAVHVL